MILAFIHVIFPKYFDWENELQSVSLINKQLMYVHTFFIALVVFLFGMFCFFSAEELLNTKLGKQVVLALAVFWGLRMLFQFFVYSPKLWKGKALETFVHIVFSLIWTYFTVVFLAAYLM
ncbi:hypothetical protein MYP_3512 [Sporocytophaga myxococcoides]|uniref:Uncharacterized protein n=2 Tax=Sporocytophaga myxococcoides TaxID=153721 RepID=A0A098LJP6_9BACT|nr:hypothetical protein MYP_3512 [Sporocytophaga myxococcoides]